jgi:lipopolysaccharide/colanic/teichoic acid biosynthesis glycosyltransferase
LPAPQESSPSPTSQDIARKQLFSRLIALVLLIPALPIMGLLALLVRLTSAGPAIYRQTRVGYQGREFVMLKIRTMRQDAEAESGPVWAAQKDSRATLVGSLLRRVHLDELPQLINVVRGEMCLVGPRPERPEIVARLRHQIPGYLDRLSVPPGIAGLAQVRQGGDVDLESVTRKQALDLAYIRNTKKVAWLDFRILAATALMLIGPGRDAALKLCGLSRIQPITLEEQQVVALDRAA